MPYSKQELAKRIYFNKQSADDYTAFWIRYKPDRVARQRIGRSRVFLFTYTLIMMALAVPFFFMSLNSFYFLLIIGCFVSAMLAPIVNATGLGHLFAPTHVELSENGLQFHWLRLFHQGHSPVISWDRISHVTTTNKTIANQEEITVEFNAITRGINFQKRWQYFTLSPALAWGWLTSDRAQIRLPVDAIASSDDRKRLQLALKKFLPSYRIEPKVADDLNMYIRIDTYTDLWLDKLNEGDNRSRDTSLEPGATLLGGGYEVIKQFGSGGQALIYLASMHKALPELIEGSRNTDTMIDFSDLPVGLDQTGDGTPSTVVLKEFVLPTQAGIDVRKRVLDNIQKEAKLWRKLRHPNIARLIDFFVEDQRAYLVLEHVEGSTLKDLVTNRGVMNEQTMLLLAIQMCDILGYLHRHQPAVIHRDFTPDNLILTTFGTLKLIDFNVAFQLEAQTTKTVVGKHSYIPPEQFRGKAVQQSDIYAMGATIFFLLTGEEPEPITVQHPRAVRTELSERLDEIVAKTTSLQLATRYQDCQELKTDLVALMKLYAPEE